MAGGRAWSRSGGGRYCARGLAVRAGVGGPGDRGWLLGVVEARYRGVGGSDARRRLQSRLSRLSLLPLPRPLPPEIPRRACSSVDMRGGRAWLLLPLPRFAARRPTSEKGGRSCGRRREVVRCARGALAVPGERAWERAQH